jgi:hypothetical protein
VSSVSSVTPRDVRHLTDHPRGHPADVLPRELVEHNDLVCEVLSRGFEKKFKNISRPPSDFVK